MTDFSALAARLSGRLLSGTDDGAAAAVQPFNLAITHRPDAVVEAADEADVIETVRFAREHGIPVRVHATGHGAHDPIEHGIVLSLARLNSVEVDAGARTATVGGGARWDAVLAAAGQHGLAAVPGAAATVGVTGYLLGGGLGPLTRSHGFSSDRVQSARVVTGAGEAVTASATEHPELFWALRGGKGGFGVVTAITVELLDLPTLYAGSLFFDIADAEAVLNGWMTWGRTAPDDVSTSVLLVRFPDLDVVPPPLRARHLIGLRFAYPGDTETGAELAAPLRALAPVHLDALGELPAAQMARIHNDPTEPGPGYGHGLMLDDVDERFVTTLLDLLGAGSELPVIAAEIRQLGGAVLREGAVPSAVGYRDFGYAMHLVGVPDPSLFDAVLPAVFDRILGALAPWVSPHTTINWLDDPTDPAGFASAWPDETRTRLAALRRELDPDGVLPYGPNAG